MNRKRAMKIVVVAAVVGLVVFLLSSSAQMLRARQLQAAGRNICPGCISKVYDSALMHGGVGAASSSALLVLLHRRRRNLPPADRSA